MSSTSQNKSTPKAGKGKKIKLEQGVYVAARNLAMEGIAKFGVHQFVFIILRKTARNGPVQSFGKNKFIVFGAYNGDTLHKDRLRYTLNAESDLGALRQYMNGVGGLQVSRVNYPNEKRLGRKLWAAARHYNSFENRNKKNHIHYPKDGGWSFLGCISGSTYNSNSWAQSLVHHTLGPNLVTQDFSGIDICNANRIPSRYFK